MLLMWFELQNGGDGGAWWELGVDEAEEAVPDGGGYEEEENEGGKKTVADVAVEGTAVPLEEEGDGDGDGVARVEDPATAVAVDDDEALGVEVKTPRARVVVVVGKATGTMGFSCKMCASHSSLRRSISDTLARKKE